MTKSPSGEAKTARGGAQVADGSAVLRDHVRRLRKLAGFGGASAEKVARALKSEVRKQVAAGLGPDGRPLQLTQEGKRPLQKADEAITVDAVGSTVVMRTMGHHARHHHGAVKGKIKRLLLPTADIPKPMVRAITRVMNGEFRKIMGDSVD